MNYLVQSNCMQIKVKALELTARGEANDPRRQGIPIKGVA